MLTLPPRRIAPLISEGGSRAYRLGLDNAEHEAIPRAAGQHVVSNSSKGGLSKLAQPQRRTRLPRHGPAERIRLTKPPGLRSGWRHARAEWSRAWPASCGLRPGPVHRAA